MKNASTDMDTNGHTFHWLKSENGPSLPFQMYDLWILQNASMMTGSRLSAQLKPTDNITDETNETLQDGQNGSNQNGSD